jgi:hypothetical protein
MKHCSNTECAHLIRFNRIAEYRDEAVTCSDCGGSLSDGEVPDPKNVSFRELVTIYESQDQIRGHLLRSLLEQREIPAVVIGDALGAAVGELPVLTVRVQVPPEFVREASRLALAFDAGELEA